MLPPRRCGHLSRKRWSWVSGTSKGSRVGVSARSGSILAQSFCLGLVEAIRDSAPIEPFALLDTAHHRVVKEVCVRDA